MQHVFRDPNQPFLAPSSGLARPPNVKRRDGLDMQENINLGKKISAFFDEVFVKVYAPLVELDKQHVRSVMTYARLSQDEK